jgi:hypothetical protein
VCFLRLGCLSLNERPNSFSLNLGYLTIDSRINNAYKDRTMLRRERSYDDYVNLRR